MFKNILFRKKVYSPEFKLEKTLEAISANNIPDIARKYNLEPSLLLLWKEELLEKGISVFEKRSNQEANKLKSKISKLEKKLAKRELELNILKSFFK